MTGEDLVEMEDPCTALHCLEWNSLCRYVARRGLKDEGVFLASCCGTYESSTWSVGFDKNT